jgi:hypothetical protein
MVERTDAKNEALSDAAAQDDGRPQDANLVSLG